MNFRLGHSTGWAICIWPRPENYNSNPNFQLQPKHIYLPSSAQTFHISLIYAFIGRPYSVNILERHPIFLSSGGLERASSGLSGLVFTISFTVRQHKNKNSRFLRLPTAGCSLNSKIFATPCISKQPPLGEHRGREQVQACLCWPSPSATLPPAPWTTAAAAHWRRRTGGGAQQARSAKNVKKPQT